MKLKNNRIKRVAVKSAKKSIKGKKPIQKIVKATVRGMAEKKFVRYLQTLNFGAYNTSSWVGNGLQPLTPFNTFVDIAQGDGENQRDGNSIRTHRLMYRGYVYALPYNATSNPTPRPQEVMMVIFSTRENNTTLTTSLPQFINNGGSSIQPQGTLVDNIQEFNTDRYTIYYKKVFKVGYADYAGTGASAAAQNYANNDFKILNRFSIDCTKWCPKNLKFNDTDNTPTTRILYVAWLPVNYDGTAQASALITTQVTASWVYQFVDV